MKKALLVVLILSLGFTDSAFGQLEVIDKVAGVLIPGITNGIKEVLSSTSGNKVKKEEVTKLGNDLMSKAQGIVDGISKDSKNITALNELFSTTGKLYDNIGSMKSLTNRFFLDQIISTNSQELYNETARQFALQWQQIESKKDDLISKTADAPSGSVQDDIAKYVASLDDNLNYLSTTLKLTKDPMADMDLDTGRVYVTNLIRANEYIDEIEEAVDAINIQLSSRIRSLNTSLENAQSEINKTLEEFNKNYGQE